MPPPHKKVRRLGPTKAVEEISFDLSSRQDYLLGFHKRKLARAKHARDIAEKREREDRIRDRKKLRETRAQDLERRIEQVNASIRADVEAEKPAVEDAGEDTEDEEESGDGEAADNGNFEEVRLDHENEYIDEDKYTTVVVEEVDVDRDGLHKARPIVTEVDGSDGEVAGGQSKQVEANGQTDLSGRRKWTREKPKDAQSQPKKKRKKFRYESKAERKVSRQQERNKNSKQARARRERD